MQAEIQRFAERWSECAVEGRVIQIRGDSYRLRQARQSGLIGGKQAM